MPARAIATVKLEITVDSSWGDDCPVKQIYKQASDSVLIELGNLIGDKLCRIRIVGDPIIESIITKQ